MSPKSLLAISQVYPPDAAAVGQYVSQACEEMVARGWKVRVLTSNRDYDDPKKKFVRRETLRGVEVYRLPFSSFGKEKISHRLAGQLSLVAQSILRGLFSDADRLLVTTIPTISSLSALALKAMRQLPTTFWLMDLNPDQIVASGQMRKDALPVRAFDFFNRQLLDKADQVVVLDRFMAERIQRKLDISDKLSIIPPWPLADFLQPVSPEENPFLDEHGLRGKRVIMYSGNHSMVHPLQTALDASLLQRSAGNSDNLHFVFVGGGVGKKAVEDFIVQNNSKNILSLPYQPLEKIKYSLSAADVHLVSMGNEMVGCVHPCKFYSTMALAKPVLLLGPQHCHIGDHLKEHDIGWRVGHGEVQRLAALFDEIANCDATDLQEKGERAKALVDRSLNKERLCSALCDILEKGENIK
jgi:colanic acid biosynthesis glycosyl transferase WcaI